LKELSSSDELHLGSVIECNTLTYNNWPNSLRKNWRYNDYNPSCTIGWIPSLSPVRGRTPVNASIVAVLECLVLLELSDPYCVLIFHTISIMSDEGTFKKKMVDQERLELS
jgi:hypothetical protein